MLSLTAFIVCLPYVFQFTEVDLCCVWCSIGAVRMKNECSVFKAHCNDRNLEGYALLVLCLHLSSPGDFLTSPAVVCPWLCFRCRRSLQKMKREHATLKQKLESYFQVVHQTPFLGNLSLLNNILSILY